jgi:hypothetical protein
MNNCAKNFVTKAPRAANSKNATVSGKAHGKAADHSAAEPNLTAPEKQAFILHDTACLVVFNPLRPKEGRPKA